MNQTLIVLIISVTAMVTYSYGSFRERININYVNDKKYSPSFQYAPHVKESKHSHVYQQLLAAGENLSAKLHATPTLDIIRHYVNHQTNKGVNKGRDGDLTFINGKVRIPTRPRPTAPTSGPEGSAVYIDLLNSTHRTGNKQIRRNSRSHNNTNVRDTAIRTMLPITHVPHTNGPSTHHPTDDNNTTDINPYLLILPLRTLHPPSKPNTSISDSMKRNRHSKAAENNSNSNAFEQNDNTSSIHLQMRNLNKYIYEKLINHLVRNKKHLPPRNYLATGKRHLIVDQMRNVINHKLSAAQMFKANLLDANQIDTIDLKSVENYKSDNILKPNLHKTVSKSRVGQIMPNDVSKKSHTETKNSKNFKNNPNNNHCTNTFKVNEYDHTNQIEQDNILMKSTDDLLKNIDYATNDLSESLRKKSITRSDHPKQDNLYFYQLYALNNDRKRTKEVERSSNVLAHNNLLVQSEGHFNNDILFQDSTHECYDVKESSTESAQSQTNKLEDEANLSFNDIVTRFHHTKQKKRTIHKSDEPNVVIGSAGSVNSQQNVKQHNMTSIQSKQTNKLNVDKPSSKQTDSHNSNMKLSVILDYVTVMLRRSILNRRRKSLKGTEHVGVDRLNRLRDRTSLGGRPFNYNLYNDQRITYISAKDSNSADTDLNLLFRPFKRKAKITGLMYNVVSNNDQTDSNEENNLNVIDVDDSDMSMLNLLLKALV